MDNFTIDGINIEVTTCCPLRCPQCYCSLEGGKHADFELVKKNIEEAHEAGITHVEFSGGETLCYPYIVEAVAFAASKGIAVSIAISGWKFDQAMYDRLTDAGIDSIHVSLNAPTEEINKLSRDGFDYSIQALELLKKNGFENTIINWVMHSNTADTLPEMIKLAEKYNACAILVIDPKPNSKNELETYPTAEQIRYVADMIKKNKSDVQIVAHHCFSALAALSSENKLWGNMNRGLYKGCTAGLCSFCITADGDFIPCRHLEISEKFSSVKEYWNGSEVIKSLRRMDDNKREPCASCRYSDYCRHCPAINHKLKNELFIGNEYCPVYEKKN